MDIRKYFLENQIKITESDSGWHADHGIALIYPRASHQMLGWAEKEINFIIPQKYKEFLLKSNGAFYKEWSFYGVPMSRFKTGMFGDSLECLDITLANQNWKSEFNLPDTALTMIGGIEGYQENTGIFLDAEGNYFLVNSCRTEELKEFNDLLKIMTA